MRLRDLGDVYYTVQSIEGALFGCTSGNLQGLFEGQPVVISKNGRMCGQLIEAC
jgi:hypothetical protein